MVGFVVLEAGDVRSRGRPQDSNSGDRVKRARGYGDRGVVCSPFVFSNTEQYSNANRNHKSQI